ncbi:lipopolysaccharide heptosyltransferase II [Sodalis-like secondary symbiont of Drepanosiphum platanoidis]|uniref:lipopolysaccharide heptosyltransferase II n=1 Tax=Sodalis-like secondary symbiont of Drepanosiphum platanoidis TaxID=2994493 RepID=UPI0034647CB1
MKILIIGPSWIGDMIMSHSLYRILIKKYPKIKIDVMAPKWSYPLLKRMPEINKSIILPFSHGEISLCKRYNIGIKLRNKNYEQAIILPNSFKSALIPFFAKIPLRTGWIGEKRYGIINDLRKNNTLKFSLMIEKYSILAFSKKEINNSFSFPKPFLYPILKVNKKEKHYLYKKFYLNKNYRPLFGLCPGSASKLAKCWPYYHYASLAKKLIKDGYNIIIFGSKYDQDTGESIINILNIKEKKYCTDLTGMTSINEAIILIDSCNGIVSNDSGLMHIASALHKPLIALYGFSNPKFTPPLFKKSIILHCIKNFKNFDKKLNNYYNNNLIKIKPKKVFKKIKILMNDN